MKQIKLLGVLALALSLGLAACDNAGGEQPGGDSQGTQTSVEECKKHTWGDWQVVQEATCTVDGSQKRTCSVCGKEETKTIKAGHKYGDWVTVTESTCAVKGSAKRTCSVCNNEETKELALADHTWGDWVTVTEADCTNAGSRKHTCSVCNTEESEAVPALDHDWVKAADQTGAVEPTCTEGGTEVQECSRCHEKQTVTVEELGHDFSNPHDLEIPGPTETNTKGEIPFKWAKITNYSCSRGDSYRYAWSAKEVNFDYANVAEGAEPELLDDGEGIRFFGRPIGNAMELNPETGEAANRGDTEKVPDRTVKGSRFEFDFVFDEDLTDVCLSAEFTPASYTSDVFKNGQGVEEWTPGYTFTPKVDENGDPVLDDQGNQVYEEHMIETFRYIILLDGVEVELDASVSNRANGRRWYQFPCKLNLSKGKHNLNIAMAGGYRHVFYNFAFEKVAPAHQHNFATETKVDKKGDGYVDYYTATCPKEGAQQIRIAAMDGTFADGSSNKTGNGAPLAGYLKIGGNNQSISYKFDWAGQAKTAKLYQYGYMDNFSSNGNRTYTSIQNGQNVGPSGCNFGVNYNGDEVAISDATKAITYADFFADATVSPGGNGNSNLAACYIGDVALVNGDNTFTFTRYASYNLSISNFLLVIE